MTWLINDFSDSDIVDSICKPINEILLSNEEKESVIFWLSEIDRERVITFYLQRKNIIGDNIKDKIILVLNSPGGDIDSAYLLCQLLRSHCKKFEIVVPLWAKSAATLLCLSADKTLMTPIAELGPLDVQVREPGEVYFKGALDDYQAIMHVRREAFSAFDHAVQLILHGSGGMAIRDILKPAADFVSSLVSPLYSQIDPVKLGKRARELDIGYQYAISVLRKYCKLEEDLCCQVANRIVYDYPSHSFTIDFDELKSLHINVELIEHYYFDMLIAILFKLPDFNLIGSFLEQEEYTTSEEDTAPEEDATPKDCITADNTESAIAQAQVAATYLDDDEIKDANKEEEEDGGNL